MSCLPATATSAMTFPVAGLMSSSVSPPAGSTHSPPMNSGRYFSRFSSMALLSFLQSCPWPSIVLAPAGPLRRAESASDRPKPRRQCLAIAWVAAPPRRRRRPSTRPTSGCTVALAAPSAQGRRSLRMGRGRVAKACLGFGPPRRLQSSGSRARTFRSGAYQAPSRRTWPASREGRTSWSGSPPTGPVSRGRCGSGPTAVRLAVVLVEIARAEGSLGTPAQPLDLFPGCVGVSTAHEVVHRFQLRKTEAREHPDDDLHGLGLAEAGEAGLVEAGTGLRAAAAPPVGNNTRQRLFRRRSQERYASRFTSSLSPARPFRADTTTVAIA